MVKSDGALNPIYYIFRSFYHYTKEKIRIKSRNFIEMYFNGVCQTGNKS